MTPEAVESAVFGLAATVLLGPLILAGLGPPVIAPVPSTAWESLC